MLPMYSGTLKGRNLPMAPAPEWSQTARRHLWRLMVSFTMKNNMPWQRISLTKQDIRDARANLKKASFLLDEGVDPQYAELIRRRGHKAEHAADVGLSGHPDENVLAYAQREDRILLTHDLDFLCNRQYPPSRNPGIILLPQAAGVKSALVTAIEDLLSFVAISRDLWRNTKITISVDRIWTVHTFERETGQVTINRYRISKNGVWMWENVE